jgi:hypothetical protein
MDPQNANMLWNIVCALFAGSTAIIAWFTKNHYQDIDKRLDSLEAFEKQITERIHQIALQQAKEEPLASAIIDLKTEVKELRHTVGKLEIAIYSQGYNGPSQPPASQ